MVVTVVTLVVVVVVVTTVVVVAGVVLLESQVLSPAVFGSALFSRFAHSSHDMPAMSQPEQSSLQPSGPWQLES